MEAADPLGPADSERFAQIDQAVAPAEQALRGGSAAAGEGRYAGEAQTSGQGEGDPLRLVVATREAPPPVERHGDYPITVADLLAQGFGQGQRQVASKVVEASELEPPHHGVERWLVAPEREEPVEGGRTLPAGPAAVIRGEGMGGERPAADRAGRVPQRREGCPAARAKVQGRPCRRERPVAAQARGRQQQMEQPVEQKAPGSGCDAAGSGPYKSFMEAALHRPAHFPRSGRKRDVYSQEPAGPGESLAPVLSGYAAKEGF